MDRARLAQVARRYWLDDLSKTELSAELGLSRFKVARLLDQARELGVVTITVHDEEVHHDLSTRLRERLGLRSAVVVRGSAVIAEDRRGVADAASRILPGMVSAGDLLGLCWSRTVDLMVRELDRLPRCDVVQLDGALSSGGSASTTVEMTLRAANLAGGVAHPLHSPLFIDHPTAAGVLRGHPAIASTLAMADRLDVAVMAVGAWRREGSAVWDAVGEELRDRITAAGVVAEIGGRLLDDEGHPVATDLDDMVIGVSLAQICRARRRLALVSGPGRGPALVAAVAAGVVTDVVTNAPTAAEILEHA